MQIDKWKDGAELIALIAVVLTLVAVAVELRQTQTALQAQAYQARAFDGIEWNFSVQTIPGAREMIDRLYADDFDVVSLTEEETRLAITLMATVYIDLDNEHYQYTHGFLDAGFFENETIVRIRKSAPIWRALGLTEKRPEFRDEVGRILAETENPAAP